MGYTLVVALMGAFTIYAGFSFISETVVKEAKLRVEMDLNSAWHSYDDEKALIEMAVSMATQHESLRGVLRGRTDITDMIPQMRVLADKYLYSGISTGRSPRQPRDAGWLPLQGRLLYLIYHHHRVS